MSIIGQPERVIQNRVIALLVSSTLSDQHPGRRLLAATRHSAGDSSGARPAGVRRAIEDPSRSFSRFADRSSVEALSLLRAPADYPLLGVGALLSSIGGIDRALPGLMASFHLAYHFCVGHVSPGEELS
jgi:hypothetical protein